MNQTTNFEALSLAELLRTPHREFSDSNYRRGFVHGLVEAIDAINDHQAEPDELGEYVDYLMERWRYVSTNTLIMPPSFNDWQTKLREREECQTMGPIIYLISPYSDPDPAVRAKRFRDACLVAAALLQTGHSVFSPIAFSHPLVEYGLPTDWSFWERYNREHLARCHEVLVLKLDGWEESVGVQEEIRIAWQLGKPIWFLDIARQV